VRDASVWGAVAQLGERLVRNEEVSGSIPLSSTKNQSLREKIRHQLKVAATNPVRLSQLDDFVLDARCDLTILALQFS
jgi:hypothetical protein